MFPPVLMFVAGSPDLGDRAPLLLGYWGRIAAGAIPASVIAPEPEPRTNEVWHLPGEMRAAVEVVLAEVARLRVQLRVVDVNRPATDRYLVERYVTADDVLPLLIRSDQSRLSGLDEFTPKTVRRFLAHG